jgi:hypothetical protein
MAENPKSTSIHNSDWVEPPYDLDAGHAANQAAEANNPAFKKLMDEAREKAKNKGKTAA